MAGKIANLVIRAMRPADIDQCMYLVASAHWNQTPQDWQMLLKVPGHHLVATLDGLIVGTICSLDYQMFNWIAMVLVHPQFRRQGIATRLMEETLQLGSKKTFRLDATRDGANVYEGLGFKPVDTLARWMLDKPAKIPTMPISSNIYTPLCFDKIQHRDERVFGADRSPVLQRLVEAYPGRSAGLHGTAEPSYISGRTGRLASHIGPIIAHHLDDAEGLLQQILHRFPEESFFLDTFDHPEWQLKLKKWGFQRQRDFIRMQLGSSRDFGIRSAQFAIGGPELG